MQPLSGPGPRRIDSLLDVLLFPRPWLRSVAMVLWMVAVTELFRRGQQPVAVGLFEPPWDKVVHLLFYGALTVCAWGVAGGAPSRRASLLVLLSSLLVGALDEWVQSFTPGRSAGIDDWLADATGALLALVLLHRRRMWRLGVRQQARS